MIVTVPVALPNRLIELGLTPRLLRIGAFTFRFAVTPPQGPSSAVMVEARIVATGAVPMANVAVFDLPGVAAAGGASRSLGE